MSDSYEVGSCFGESSLLNGDPHEATIIADGDVSLLVISRESFDALCGSIAAIQSWASPSEFARAPSLSQKLKIPGFHVPLILFANV
jgi:CRP-like cAMP-binding protein